MDEIAHGHALLAFRLHLEQGQRRSSSATHEQTIVLDQEFSGRKGMRRRCCVPDVQISAAKSGEGTGPRLKPTQAIPDFLCRVPKIDPAIFFLEDGRESCFRIILRARTNCASLQSAQSLDREISADSGQRESKTLSRICGVD